MKTELDKVTRLEIIDQYERRLVLSQVQDVVLYLQDEERTLKVFLYDNLRKENFTVVKE